MVDKLEPGSEADWIHEFLTQHPSLIHGYFVTRTSFPSENWTWDERRQQELQYFESPQWHQNGVDAYCGTEKFAAGLVKVLDRLLRRRYSRGHNMCD